MQEIKIGELSVMVAGVHLSLRNLPSNEKQRIANELGEIIIGRLQHQFEGEFRFRIISIVDGCIKIKLEIIWKTVCDNTEKAIYLTAALTTIAMGAQQLFEQGEPTITIQGGGIACVARYSGSDLVPGCYYTTESGDNLSKIVSKFSFHPHTRNQAMVALYSKNPHAFYKANINAVKTGVLLIFPTHEEINRVGSIKADEIVNGDQQAFKNKQ